MKYILPALLMLLCSLTRGGMVRADELDQDFVIATVIVADPGDVLYSRVGHCALHLKCPEHDLDYVFSYESENARNHILKFLAGKLKMGMFAIPIQDYLDVYQAEGRGVREYTLNLPIEYKREMWRILDNHVMEGANLPYDYLNRGCAHSVLNMIKECLDSVPIEYGPWPKKFNTMTRREIAELQMKDYPWSKAVLYVITNGSIDSDCSKQEKIIIPTDLVEVLSNAKVFGKPLLSTKANELVIGTRAHKKTWFTPLLIAVILLVLTLLAHFTGRQGLMAGTEYTMLSIQTFIGLITVYLVFFSNLVCTEWSWLIVPFNPLPAVFWKWRKYWAAPFAAIDLIWAIAMIAYPHSITIPEYIVLAIALVADYIHIFMSYRKRSPNQ